MLVLEIKPRSSAKIASDPNTWAISLVHGSGSLYEIFRIFYISDSIICRQNFTFFFPIYISVLYFPRLIVLAESQLRDEWKWKNATFNLFLILVEVFSFFFFFLALSVILTEDTSCVNCIVLGVN